MTAANALSADNTDQAGFPPAPSETHQRAVVEITSEPRNLQLLNPASHALLASYGLTLESDPMVPGGVRVHDSLGRFRFVCTEGIARLDLQAMLTYGGECYREGEADGLAATTRRVLNNLLNGDRVGG